MNWVLGNNVLDGSSVPYDTIVNEIQHFFRLILKHINQPKKVKVFESTAMVQKKQDTKHC
jgi:hypothetical protein